MKFDDISKAYVGNVRKLEIKCGRCKVRHIDVEHRFSPHLVHSCEECGEEISVDTLSVGVEDWDLYSGEVFDKWSVRFMELCELIGNWSKDPSTQNGSILVDKDRVILGTGYNGYPRGVLDKWYNNRTHKYNRIVHAEANTILSSTVVLRRIEGVRLYSGMFPCEECAKLIIQSGIKEIVTNPPKSRWRISADISQEMFRQSGVKVALLINPEKYE